GQAVAELLVVDAEVVDDDAALGDAGRATGLKNIRRLAGKPPGNPSVDRATAEPVVLEVLEADDVGERLYFPPRVPAGLARPIEPEGGAGLGTEVPLHHVAHVGVEPLARLADLGLGGCVHMLR